MVLYGSRGTPIRHIYKLMSEDIDFISRHKKRRSTGYFYRLNGNKMGYGWRPDLSVVDLNWAGVDREMAKAINSPESIVLSSSKFEARIKMQKDGVDVIPTWLYHEIPTDYEGVIIGRPFSHLGGQDFGVYNSIVEIPTEKIDGYYYSPFIAKVNEYRVHTTTLGVLDLKRKSPAEGVDVDLDEPQPWNLHTGNFRFHRINPNYYSQKLVNVAIDAMVSMGHLFDAVDILEDAEGNFWVTEVNTSPGMKGSLYIQYADFFDEVVRRGGLPTEIEKRGYWRDIEHFEDANARGARLRERFSWA